MISVKFCYLSENRFELKMT